MGSYVNRLPILQEHLRSFEVYNNGSCAVDERVDDMKKAINDVNIADNHSTASSFHGNGNDDYMTRRCMKGPRLEGQRNMQDTTFSINGKFEFPRHLIIPKIKQIGNIFIYLFFNDKILNFLKIQLNYYHNYLFR